MISHTGLDLLFGDGMTHAHGDVAVTELGCPSLDGAHGAFSHLVQLALGALVAVRLWLGDDLQDAAPCSLVDADHAVDRATLGRQELVQDGNRLAAESDADADVDEAVVLHPVTGMCVADGNRFEPRLCQGAPLVGNSDRTVQLYRKNSKNTSKIG